MPKGNPAVEQDNLWDLWILLVLDGVLAGLSPIVFMASNGLV
jgi:hypothetical protein